MAREGICTSFRRDGSPCAAPVLGNGSQCWAHDPALAEKRAEKRKLGGRNRANVQRAGKLIPAQLRPVVTTLLSAIGEVHDGQLDPRAAAAMAALVSALVRVWQAATVEQEITELRDQVAALSRRQA